MNDANDRVDINEPEEVHVTDSPRLIKRNIFILCIFVKLIIGVIVVALPVLDSKFQREDSYLSNGFISHTAKAKLFKDANKSTRRAVPKKKAKKDPLRVLYVITSLAEYNTGRRSTDKGSDRLQDTLIPVMREGVLSMREMDYQVDVFLICHWSMKTERLQLVRRALPSEVGLDYWDDATPLGYKLEDENHPEKSQKIAPITRALARQHRFVIKDKILDYDFL